MLSDSSAFVKPANCPQFLGKWRLNFYFAKDIGWGKQLDPCFSHLKRRQCGYSVSAQVLSFLQMIIKGGDRLSDIDLLQADQVLLSLLSKAHRSLRHYLARLEIFFRSDSAA